MTPGNERGSIVPFFAVAVVGMLLTAGLVADGGVKVRAVQRADQYAAEAARAGGQAINLADIQNGAQPRVNPAAAVAAAQHYLHTAGITGTATVTGNATTIHVHTVIDTDTVFLGLIGVHTLTVAGNAEASLIHSVTGEPQ